MYFDTCRDGTCRDAWEQAYLPHSELDYCIVTTCLLFKGWHFIEKAHNTGAACDAKTKEDGVRSNLLEKGNIFVHWRGEKREAFIK